VAKYGCPGSRGRVGWGRRRQHDDSSIVIAVEFKNAGNLCDTAAPRLAMTPRPNQVIGRRGKGYCGTHRLRHGHGPMGDSTWEVAAASAWLSCPTGALVNREWSRPHGARARLVGRAGEQPTSGPSTRCSREYADRSALDEGAVVRRPQRKGEIIAAEGAFGSTASDEKGTGRYIFSAAQAVTSQKGKGPPDTGWGLLGLVKALHTGLVGRRGEDPRARMSTARYYPH